MRKISEKVLSAFVKLQEMKHVPFKHVSEHFFNLYMVWNPVKDFK